MLAVGIVGTQMTTWEGGSGMCELELSHLEHFRALPPITHSCGSREPERETEGPEAT